MEEALKQADQNYHARSQAYHQAYQQRKLTLENYYAQNLKQYVENTIKKLDIIKIRRKMLEETLRGNRLLHIMTIPFESSLYLRLFRKLKWEYNSKEDIIRTLESMKLEDSLRTLLQYDNIKMEFYHLSPIGAAGPWSNFSHYILINIVFRGG